jgi:ABC-type transport system involved in cytochrome bd biosynthesis fused ATPase/permease subunit
MIQMPLALLFFGKISQQEAIGILIIAVPIFLIFVIMVGKFLSDELSSSFRNKDKK